MSRKAPGFIHGCDSDVIEKQHGEGKFLNPENTELLHQAQQLDALLSPCSTPD